MTRKNYYYVTDNICRGGLCMLLSECIAHSLYVGDGWWADYIGNAVNAQLRSVINLLSLIYHSGM